MTELERISQNTEGQKAPPVQVIFEVAAVSPKETLERIISIIVIVVKASNMTWPNDSWWETELPIWFRNSFNHSIDEIRKNRELWGFGSWIDANKYRGWQWWSSEILENRVRIILNAYEDPYVVGPLEYIIRSSGGRIISLKETA